MLSLFLFQKLEELHHIQNYTCWDRVTAASLHPLQLTCQPVPQLSAKPFIAHPAQICFFQVVMLEQLCILDDRNVRLNFNQSFVVSGVNVTSDILLTVDF